MEILTQLLAFVNHDEVFKKKILHPDELVTTGARVLKTV